MQREASSQAEGGWYRCRAGGPCGVFRYVRLQAARTRQDMRTGMFPRGCRKTSSDADRTHGSSEGPTGDDGPEDVAAGGGRAHRDAWSGDRHRARSASGFLGARPGLRRAHGGALRAACRRWQAHAFRDGPFRADRVFRLDAGRSLSHRDRPSRAALRASRDGRSREPWPRPGVALRPVRAGQVAHRDRCDGSGGGGQGVRAAAVSGQAARFVLDLVGSDREAFLKSVAETSRIRPPPARATGWRAPAAPTSR